jgi:hypothetical protein
MNVIDVVEAVVCITSIKKSGDFVINGRVVDVRAKISAEKALINSTIEVRYKGVILQNMVLKVGILFRVSIPLDVANSALDKIAEGVEHLISIEPELIRPMAEPSVRVPLSLLRELRGQELGTEMSRRSLVKAWSEDRKTGKSS